MNVISLEELERFTVKLYGPQTDSSLLEMANALKQRYLENSYNYQELFDHFIASSNKHCLFWLLDVLINLTNLQYKNLSPEEKAKFKNFLLFIIQNHLKKLYTENFIITKFCVLIINLLKFDYPENWPTFYKDFITMILETQDDEMKLLKVNLLVDLLLTFDDEMIKFRHISSEFDMVRSTAMKDYMRLEAVSDCLYVLNGLLQNENHFSRKLVKNSIKVVSQLIDWNSLNLFGDCLKQITSLIDREDLENEVLEVFNAIIKKGMEPYQKLELIKYLNINEMIDGKLMKSQNLTENSLSIICEIVSNIGNFTIECFEMVKSLTKGENVSEIKLNPQDLFNYICEISNYSLYHSINIIKIAPKIEVKISLHLCEYISSFTTYLKSNEFLVETLNELIRNLVGSIENSLIIPTSEYEIKSLILLNKEDDDFFYFRKEFTILYQNFFYLNTMKLTILNSINSRLDIVSSILNNESKSAEVELTLHLIHSLQSSLSNNDLQNSTILESFNKILFSLFNISFASIDSDYILILFHETVYKYLQYIFTNDNALIYITRIYLSKRGIMHENSIVGSKICNLFDKFVDKTKTQLGKLDIINEVAETLKNFLHYLCVDNKNFVTLIEYNVIFRTLCLTLLQKNFSEEKRTQMFKEVLSFFDSIIVNFGLDNEKFVELCKCITNFIKSIGFEINPNCKIIFIEYFNNFINNIYLKFPKNHKVDYSMLTIIQRLITILGKEALQYVDYFIGEQIKYPQMEMYEDYCKLLQNTTQLLKKDAKGVVQKLFFFFYEGIKTLQLPECNISDVEKNILSIFASFAKLVANITTEIVEILFENGGLQNVNLEEFFNFITYAACNIIDQNIRRTFVKSIKSIVNHILKLCHTNEYSNLNIYLDLLLSGSFKIYTKLNIQDPIDFNTLPEIVQLHYYVFKAVQTYYLNFISNFLDSQNLQSFSEHLNIYDVKKFKVSDTLINYFNVIFSKF